MTDGAIRVVLADDHPVYRQGLAAVVTDAEDVDLVGVAADGGEAVALAMEHLPDVALLDVHMPGVSGIDATRRLAVEAPQVAVLVLTMLEDDESVLAAMAAGARGYLVKGATGDRILAAIRAVAAGEAVFGRLSRTTFSTWWEPTGAPVAVVKPSRRSLSGKRRFSR